MLNISSPQRDIQSLSEIITFADLSCLADQVTDCLPFDSDNASRAGAAAAALVSFASYTGLNADCEPAETVIVDFLADMMHLCSETGMPFCEMLLTASNHFLDEQDT
ncbi:hypothetical protein SAMN03159428_04883 [Kosakonia radicincitans]|jgi:hypothetical protein|uniref:Uncharacterized protein n=1 Tax=Kosakonia radicincitans TaxID=283686 RepID=A0AAX2EZ84_9ENTR|nr:hypothetical protein [Kosakonia radicincitans]SFF37487.1 hypothetical protein SAMN03159468_04910 [Kosakonia radicincitans]SFR26128.1 hypothetical protein SAMN03159514_04870 [Kosakonia radicincitans]SFU16552.1 hypothetical protein SAMN03159428_04883 [Kosakonia radicincitans]SFY31716.1 hypothetical protein SAMN03159436_04860 [Kosakonia radicincitans]